jgi:GT2 family glycosyltransferase
VNIAAVVVTHNRKDILLDTLRALLQQGDALGAIYLTDNASSDGTKEALRQAGLLADRRLHYLRLEHNSGGAGGFAHGLQNAYSQGYDAYWLMDDDACPTPCALEHLLDAASGRLDQAAYGSAAVAWSARHEDLVLSCTAVLAQPIPGHPTVIQCHALLPEVAEVENLPFLGFLISHRLVAMAGLPDASYFIDCDDIEYGQRLRRCGAGLCLVKKSLIHHPLPQAEMIPILGRDFYHMQKTPQRRYWEVRNRLITARRYYGARLWTQTLPGIAIRLGLAMRHGDRPRAQLKAFLDGLYDGLTASARLPSATTITQTPVIIQPIGASAGDGAS